MSTWPGWQADLLSHSGIPNTTNNRRFLSDWHSHAETNCANNPIDLSVTDFDGKDCADLPGLIAKAQRYPTTAAGSHAFDTQIHQAAYAALLSVMMTGNPYTATGSGLASEALSAWGSETFAQRYFAETANAPGRGGGIVDGDALRGWTDLQRSINKRMPAALAASQATTRRALRSLGRTHRVEL